jgi:hypothetical protein
MIDQAIEKMEQTDMASETKFAESNSPDKRYNIEFPEGGLILRQTSRDLPRKNDPDYETWRHNFDHAWLTAKETKSLVPKNPTVGEKYSIPDSLVRRLARFHFVDQVKGEADAFSASDVTKASLIAEVVENQNGQVKIRLSGSAKCVKPPSGEVNPYSGNKTDKERGVKLAIQGWITYDLQEKSFRRFDLIATGDRWGTATYNFRHRDMGPAPIGFAFEMLPTKPQNMTRPKFLMWRYFE